MSCSAATPSCIARRWIWPTTIRRGNFQGRTVIVNSGAFGKFVGSLDLLVHVADHPVAGADAAPSFVKSYTYQITPITDRPWQDDDPTDPCDPGIRCDPPHPSNPTVSCPTAADAATAAARGVHPAGRRWRI